MFPNWSLLAISPPPGLRLWLLSSWSHFLSLPFPSKRGRSHPPAPCSPHSTASGPWAPGAAHTPRELFLTCLPPLLRGYPCLSRDTCPRDACLFLPASSMSAPLKATFSSLLTPTNHQHISLSRCLSYPSSSQTHFPTITPPPSPGSLVDDTTVLLGTSRRPGPTSPHPCSLTTNQSPF